MTGIPPFFFSTLHPSSFTLSYAPSSFTQIIPLLSPPFMGLRREAFMGSSGDPCLGRSIDPSWSPSAESG